VKTLSLPELSIFICTFYRYQFLHRVYLVHTVCVNVDFYQSGTFVDTVVNRFTTVSSQRLDY